MFTFGAIRTAAAYLCTLYHSQRVRPFAKPSSLCARVGRVHGAWVSKMPPFICARIHVFVCAHMHLHSHAHAHKGTKSSLDYLRCGCGLNGVLVLCVYAEGESRMHIADDICGGRKGLLRTLCRHGHEPPLMDTCSFDRDFQCAQLGRHMAKIIRKA